MGSVMAWPTDSFVEPERAIVVFIRVAFQACRLASHPSPHRVGLQGIGLFASQAPASRIFC